MDIVRVLEEIPAVSVTRSVNRDRPDVLRLYVGKQEHRFIVLARKRAPYPNETDLLVDAYQKLSRTGQPTLHVPYMPETMGVALADEGWCWYDDVGNFYIRSHPNLLLHQRVVTQKRPHPQRKFTSRTSLTAIRWLAMQHSQRAFGATELARLLDVSQPRASQLLAALADDRLVRPMPERRWAANSGLCIDAFLEHYKGPKGTTHYFYALEEPLDAALKLASATLRKGYAISADVGADLLAPSRRPSHLVAYLRHDEPLSRTDWVTAKGRHDANVIVHIPEDETMFWDAPPAKVGRHTLALVHPTQMLWDLHQLGEGDRLEAFEVLQKWITEHHDRGLASKHAPSQKISASSL